MKRRNFFRSLALGGASVAFSPIVKAAPSAQAVKEKPATNIKDALAIPRNENSMPGKYPGKVVKATHPGCIVDGQPSEEAAYEMLRNCLLNLTGKDHLKEAWLQFVGPDESESDCRETAVYFARPDAIYY